MTDVRNTKADRRDTTKALVGLIGIFAAIPIIWSDTTKALVGLIGIFAAIPIISSDTTKALVGLIGIAAMIGIAAIPIICSICSDRQQYINRHEKYVQSALKTPCGHGEYVTSTVETLRARLSVEAKFSFSPYY